MLSVYLGALGLGALGVGAGLLIGGPIALDTNLDPAPPQRNTGDALDLHADRTLGSLEGGPHMLWRPLLCPHAWTIGAGVFGLAGIGAWAAGASETVAMGAAIGVGLFSTWGAGMVLRSLPPRSGARDERQ